MAVVQVSRRSRWRDKAACSDTPLDWWATPRRFKLDDVAAAVTTCMDCPVIRECAAEAIETDDIAVIRAGVPIPDARRVDRRNATRALHAIAGGYDIRGVLWDKGVTMRGYHRG